MTARKKARTAARRVDAAGRPQATTEEIADAASDVWEPIVGDLLRVIEDPDGAMRGLYEDIIARAREALG